MNKALIVIAFIIILLIIGFASYAIGFKQGVLSTEDKLAEYKELIDYYNPTIEDIYSISGKVTDIQNKTLSVETTVEEVYTLPENWQKKIIKVKVVDQTTINQFDMETGELVEISFSKIKKGDKVYVSAIENIKGKDQFDAQTIELTNEPEVTTGIEEEATMPENEIEITNPDESILEEDLPE